MSFEDGAERLSDGDIGLESIKEGWSAVGGR